MICDLQVWIELRSISAYHFWSSLGTLVHVSLHWHVAKVCYHSLPMPSPHWWINMKEVGSRDPKEAPFCQGTVGDGDSLRAGSDGGSPGWQGPAARSCPTTPSGAGQMGWQPDMGSWPVGRWEELGPGAAGRAIRADGALWAPTLWCRQRTLSTVQLLLFSLLMNISQDPRDYESPIVLPKAAL